MRPFYIKTIFIALLVINITTIFFYNSTLPKETETVTLFQISTNLELDGLAEITQPKEPKEEYKFANSTLAYQILKKLDVYDPYPADLQKDALKRQKQAYLRLGSDYEYCDKHRAYFANNPNFIFTEKNIITGYGPKSDVRKIAIREAGTDLMPNVGGRQKRDIIDLKEDAMAFMTALDMFIYREVDRQFSCLGQMSNHIPGHGSLYRKNKAAESAIKYGKFYASRPQCFNFDKFFPKTYLLYQEESCKDFFTYMDTANYAKLKTDRNIVFMKKVGSGIHGGKGVTPFTQKVENKLKKAYENGESCGKTKKNIIMQNFVHNPLLLYGRKFDFRMYMLIASTNPLIAYYHDGCLRVSLNQYDTKETSKQTLLTNTHLMKSSFNKASKEGTLNGKTKNELKEEHSWTMQDLQEYVLEAGLVSDTNWLDNYLRPQFKEAMIHIVRMSQSEWRKQSSLFELYGLDFMLDEHMHLWFIEGNVRPGLGGHTPDNLRLKMNMLKDHFEIVFSIIRSRMKKVFHYVNDLILSGKVEINKKGEVEIPKLKKKIKEFKEIRKNFIDPEFAPRPENGFSKIIDENYSGTERYSGYISEECL